MLLNRIRAKAREETAREEGIIAGRTEGKIEILAGMLKMNLISAHDIKQICDTKLSKQDIIRLKNIVEGYSLDGENM